MNLGSVIYSPQLKWKAGERAALENFDAEWLRYVLPLFKLLPPGGFEADLKVSLQGDQFLKKFGDHLAEVRGRAPVLLDGELLDACVITSDGSHPFGQLLERARLAGANPIPVFRSGDDQNYLGSISRFLKWSNRPSACLRISLEELETFASRTDLLRRCEIVSASSKDSVLLIDAGPLQVSNDDSLAQLLAYQMSRLIRKNDWALVVFSSTTFPDAPKIAPWTSASFPRNDWRLYRELVRLKDELPLVPVFSDYGLEYPGNYKPGRAQPSAHLRYSTENKYFIFKGRSVKYDEKYANIFRVAEQLRGSGIFKGKDYSSGDLYISELQKEMGRTGNASKWRWCATDHHLTLVLNQLNSLLGVGIEEAITHVEPDQLQLILA